MQLISRSAVRWGDVGDTGDGATGHPYSGCLALPHECIKEAVASVPFMWKRKMCAARRWSDGEVHNKIYPAMCAPHVQNLAFRRLVRD